MDKQLGDSLRVCLEVGEIDLELMCEEAILEILLRWDSFFEVMRPLRDCFNERSNLVVEEDKLEKRDAVLQRHCINHTLSISMTSHFDRLRSSERGFLFLGDNRADFLRHDGRAESDCSIGRSERQMSPKGERTKRGSVE
jgi:hypothetical protein